MMYLNNLTRISAVLLCMVITCAHSVKADGEEYFLGVGDVVGVDVRNMGQKEYTIDALRIPATGRLSLPLLGSVNFTGRTTDQLEVIVSDQLSEGYLNQPEVTINVVEYRPFYVRGGVNTPGAFQYQFGLTVEKAIAIAGGVSTRGQLDSIAIAREKDQDSKGVTLRDTVRPGDVVSVALLEPKQTKEDENHEVVYLYGEVQNPGGYDYHEGLTVEKAIALAGGFSERASKRKLSIKRTQDSQTYLRKKVPLTEPILPGDIVSVGQSYF